MDHINFSKTRQELVSSSIQGILVVLILLFSTSMAFSETAREIDVSVDATLDRFNKEILGADGFIKKAKGVLIFPQVIKVGFGIGGEYGEGALRIGKTVEYYSTVAASIGFQFGA